MSHMTKRNYTLAGLTLAVLVFGLIVVAGTIGGGSSTAPAATVDASTQAPLGASALPSGHPSVGGADQGAGVTGSGNDLSAMIASLEKKYRQNPDSVEAGAALADAYLMDEQPDKALKLYNDLLAADPGNGDLRAQLAMAYHAKRDDDRATALLDAVLAGDPGNQTAHYNLAIIYFSQDRTDEAKQEWQAAARIDPASRLGVSAQNFVDLMEGRTPAPTATGNGQ
jgi:Flp pilus assembly protein TadD